MSAANTISAQPLSVGMPTAGVMEFEADEAAPVPALLVAVTVKV